MHLPKRGRLSAKQLPERGGFGLRANLPRRVVCMLAERRGQLDRIARQLLECEVLDRDALLKVLTENELAANDEPPGAGSETRESSHRKAAANATI
jgi:hypothetical protein